jgi:hypothetical protein
MINYKNLYLEYKMKYINFKNKLKGGTNSTNSTEIISELTILTPGIPYFIQGLNTCVGLVITKMETGNPFTAESGIGIHILNAGMGNISHFIDTEFTERGEEMLNNLEGIISQWKKDDAIDIVFYTNQRNKQKSTSILIEKLKDFFTKLGLTNAVSETQDVRFGASGNIINVTI